MDRGNIIDANEFSVNEGAFWHTNMDLYYGYQPGEVVEVEHESNKYWLATIEYSFRHLILLKWIGNYGEFWVDTSPTSSSLGFTNEFSASKRLFPPGYHLQSQLKSLFTLERPTKVLVKPSLYNPANDPYAEVRTVDDLLTLEVNQNDAFGNQTSANNEPASLALAKCKTKISYSQEDVDELDAALQNLNEIDSGNHSMGESNESPDNHNFNNNHPSEESKNKATDDEEQKPQEGNNSVVPSEKCLDSTIITTQTCQPIVNNEEFPTIGANVSGETLSQPEEASLKKLASTKCNEIALEPKVDHEANIEECIVIQNMAINLGKYCGINENSKKVYHMKPKQFFDIGGANQERVLVPGTLLEVAHIFDSGAGLELHHWFAVVLKNVGGRLTLRWFLCDEPKFKQGRLELKSCRSKLIREDDDQEENSSDNKADSERCRLIQKTRIPAKDITFCMHFCNPCIHSISHAKKSNHRTYKIPIKMLDFIEENKGAQEAGSMIQTQMDYIFDCRRTNLDKDRPIIDHLLATVRSTSPYYVKVTFAPNDNHSRREVLLSTPKTTRLLRGFVKRELEPGVFEVHSEQASENGEVIKFIYPYDSSYSILPTNWAVNNEDCLSVQPSRNPTPIPVNVDGNQQQTSTTTIASDQDSGVGQADSTELTDNGEQSQLEQQEEKERECKCIIEPESELDNAREILDIIEKSYPHDVSPADGPVSDELVWANNFDCVLDCSQLNEIIRRFRIMDQLEVVHPSSDTTICLGRIRKVVYPLLWIQISADSYTLLPFTSTDIYPIKWCEANSHPLVSLLPPRKRPNQAPSSQTDKKRKKTTTKICEDVLDQRELDSQRDAFEHFDLGTLTDKQLDLDCILNEKSMYIRIYFNHKCFTGPSLSKGKICSLPQYVGPGPLRLVMEEVVTKVISVAYVPPRILNDLSSKLFEELLITRNLTNTAPMEFKAKYQKRVHRENIPVCLSPDDVALYCECICEHLKCCYNLFGPNLYDGDDCPGHCRALTKSNKFMKRATYYREKARLGEFLNDNSTKKSNNPNSSAAGKTSRARYAGRDSSESTCSSVSRSEQVMNSRDSSNGEETPINELKENLQAVEEMEDESSEVKDDCTISNNINNQDQPNNRPIESDVIHSDAKDPEIDKILHQSEPEQQNNVFNVLTQKSSHGSPNGFELNLFNDYEKSIEDWTVEDVAEALDKCELGRLKWHLMSEDIDGRALLLLDKTTIREHFQHQPKSEYTLEELRRLCLFVEFAKTRAGTATGI